MMDIFRCEVVSKHELFISADERIADRRRSLSVDPDATIAVANDMRIKAKRLEANDGDPMTAREQAYDVLNLFEVTLSLW